MGVLVGFECKDAESQISLRCYVTPWFMDQAIIAIARATKETAAIGVDKNSLWDIAMPFESESSLPKEGEKKSFTNADGYEFSVARQPGDSKKVRVTLVDMGRELDSILLEHEDCLAVHEMFATT